MDFITLLEKSEAAGEGTLGFIPMLVYVAVIGLVFYFMFFKPQKNRDKERNALLTSLEIGDRILTTSGFYGVVIDIIDDTDIIVEFGNNKNCRIVMTKNAVAEVEKPETDKK